MAFTFKSNWGNNHNNNVSFKTGDKTNEGSEKFTETQITDVLQTAGKATIPEGDPDAKKLQTALAEASNKVTVTKGAHQPDKPHIAVSFDGKTWHVDIEMEKPEVWIAVRIPERKTMLVELATDYSQTLALVRKVRSECEDQLLTNPDIHGIGIGYRKIKGKETNELAIVVHVEKKVPRSALEPHRLIDNEVSFAEKGNKFVYIVHVDVQEAALPKPAEKCEPCDEDLKKRVRPVPGGYSISVGSDKNNAGTIGGWVWNKKENEPKIVLLSNNHILNVGGDKSIIQPGTLDGGIFPKDHVADYLRTVFPKLDAAIAAPVKGEIVKKEIACKEGQAVFKIAKPVLKMEVEKVGRTTGKTCGEITSIDYFSKSFPSYGKTNIIVEGDGTPFSLGGDSGSLYIQRGKDFPKTIVGLNWGTQSPNGFGLGHSIISVFEELELQPLQEGLTSLLLETAHSTPMAHSSILPEKLRFPTHQIEEDFFNGFLQDLIQGLEIQENKQSFMTFLQENDALLAKTLLSRDGWRATIVALLPILNGKVTTDEVLDYEIQDIDSSNVDRLITVAKRLNPDSVEILDKIGALVDQHKGRSVAELLKTPFVFSTEKEEMIEQIDRALQKVKDEM